MMMYVQIAIIWRFVVSLISLGFVVLTSLFPVVHLGCKVRY